MALSSRATDLANAADSVSTAIIAETLNKAIVLADSDNWSDNWQFRLKALWDMTPALGFLTFNCTFFGLLLAILNTPGAIKDLCEDVKSTKKGVSDWLKERREKADVTASAQPAPSVQNLSFFERCKIYITGRSPTPVQPVINPSLAST